MMRNIKLLSILLFLSLSISNYAVAQFPTENHSLRNYDYNISDPLILELIQNNKAKSHIKIGNAYQRKEYENERERLFFLIRENLYPNFCIENITFLGDANFSDTQYDMVLRINDRCKSEDPSS